MQKFFCACTHAESPPPLSDANKAELDRALSKLGLTHVESYVAKNNPSSHIPYHNLYHAQTVALTCWHAAQFANLSKTDKQALILAALFHDFGHSGGVLPDADNIRIATDALRFAQAALTLNPALVESAIDIISATQYPYVLEPETEMQRIIRDADLCQILYEGWESMLDGLRREMSVTTTQPVDPGEFAVKAFRFWRGAAFHSKWGQIKHAEYMRIVDEREAATRGGSRKQGFNAD